jgi:nicotinate-nucleotide adenylyltransferase
MRIGILGGTFDPIHYAHLRVAEVAIEGANLDKVIFIPNGDPPHKSKISTTAAQRWDMCNLAINGGGFELSDIEMAGKDYYYTHSTLEQLKDIYPNDELYLIVGSDAMFGFGAWKKSNRIVELAEVVVVQRVNNFISKEMLGTWIPRISFVRQIGLQISSTEIRLLRATEQSIRFLTPDSVIEYIERNDLYSSYYE